MYLFGRSFNLFTDHQPLTSNFHPQKSIPIVTAAHLQRYALFLAGYDYTIEYRNTKVHSNADGLSRLSLERELRNEEEVVPLGVFNLMQYPVLAQDYEITSKGWPYNQDPELNHFFMGRDEITLQSGCLM